MNIFYFLLLFFILPNNAHAHVFEWSDPDSGVVIQIPDTWRVVQSDDSQDAGKFRAPGVNQHAACRIRITPDKRYDIFPERLSDHAHSTRIHDEFWDKWAAREYKQHYINQATGQMGLGNGYASYADITYRPLNKPITMRGLSWASHYGDNLYVFTCAAEFNSFTGWAASFHNILSTVQMPQGWAVLPSGHYRYFIGDHVLKVSAPDGMTSYH